MHVLLAALCLSVAFGPTDTRLHVLFLGDRAYHQPEVRLDDVWGPLARRGIVLDWEDDLDAITSEVLDRYDCVVMYANHPAQSVEPAAFSESLDAYIRAGGGFAALHCTSGCFMDSPSWISLIGARFQSHGSDVFAQDVADDSHPITRNWTPFETWDETYVQEHVDDNRTLLTTRGDEPWCWTRSYGKGRIFYTASGHDHRTWTHPGWLDHLQRAIVWASGEHAAARHAGFKPVEFDFEPHDWVPNYEAHDPPMPFQLASTPEQATAALIPAAGFHAELFASEPLIVNPVAMTWDERGRCWLIESPDYPNDTRDNGVGTDRISVLEDTDGDGMADLKTVFAENLNLPTGLLKVTGGLIVASPPHLLFYEDVDGDDQADRRATLLTGFGTWDTHAGPSNLAWGPDNNVWGAIGYAGYKSEDGPTFASGLWRWDQAKLQPEFVAQFTNNTWGLGLRSDGEIFGSTANGAPSFFVGAPKPDLAASLPQHPGSAMAADSTIVHAALPQLQQGDFMGQFTAAAGHAFATGPQVPAHWPERMAFIAEPTAHLVGRQEAYPDKSGFRTRDCFNLVASTDEWFCPVQAEVGPDGAIWIADLAQFIILHNLPGNPERGLPEIDYGTGNAHLNPLRDRTHGRIYRLLRDDSTQTPDLSDATVEQLIDALSSDNRFWRITARRLLVEGMYAEAGPSLHELARGEHDFAAAEAIRTLHGLGMLGGKVATATLTEALIAARPATRHAALASLPRSELSSTLLLEAGVLEHSNAATRRHAYLAASRLSESDAIGAALAGRALSETYGDPWITLSLTAAAAAHPNAFVAATAPLLTGRDQLADLIAMVELARAQADGSLTRPGQRTLSLDGGRIAEGEQVFRTNTIAACFRCHSLDGSGTGVGPDLSTVGGRLSEAQLLESILNPNAAIAEGWTAPASAMPALAAFLTDDELRDVVAFLAAQQ